MPMRILPVIAILMPTLAMAVNFSGTVARDEKTPVAGVVVSLAGSSHSTTTDAGGRWTLASTVSVSPRVLSHAQGSNGAFASLGSGPRFGGRDAEGRASMSVSAVTRSFSAAGRASAAAPDTLVYAWNGKVFLRDTVWGGRDGISRVLDTTWNPAIIYDYLTDGRDNQTYRTVRIGYTTWLAQNLNYAGANGDTGLCYMKDALNCAKWGRLYLWDVAMAGSEANGARGICPEGWHVPTLVEWNDLQAAARAGGKKSGPRLRATTGWSAGGDASDALGFRALAGGDWYQLNGNFGNAGNFGTWFTSTSPEFFITQISLSWKEDSLWQLQKSFATGASLRCTR